MQTDFAADLKERPAFAASEKIIRKCVHCGFCTATCPTFVLLGEENDSPRGRIYLMKDMLENNRPADALTVKHVDRCLSCLSCMTTCPSGVNYMHLVDHARAHIQKTYRRPFMDRVMLRLLGAVLPHPGRFGWALRGARLAKPLAPLFPKRFAAMFAMAPARLPARGRSDRPAVHPAQGTPAGGRVKRVALLTGCAQRVLDPTINEATIRVLTRHGVEVVVLGDVGCCGALQHHMGQQEPSHAMAARNIRAFMAEKRARGLDCVVVNTSGCGTTVKDYGWMLREDEAVAADAATVSAMARDVSEVMAELDIAPSGDAPALRVAYHSACSLQHGQRVTKTPMDVLARAGYEVVGVPEGHICCGSAGTYNLLQPDIANQLKARKVANIEKTKPDVVAAGNIGCMVQIASGIGVPVVHTVQLVDWATGGPKPAALAPPTGA